jgi:hypothetical protein
MNLDVISDYEPIYISNTMNLTVTDSKLNRTTGTDEVYIDSDVNGATWNFTNVSRSDGSPINISWSAPANGTLNYGWWLDANVTSGGAALADATVNATDIFGTNKTSTTNADGLARMALLEYTRNGTGGSETTYYSNYTINASKTDYLPNSTQVNMTANKVVYLTLSEACSVDFNMSINLQQGIMFAEQDPGTINASAAGNGFYNITDLSTAGCGTVNVSIMATGDLVNGSSIIGIGNVTANSTSPDTQTIQLSTDYQLIRSNVPAGGNNITTLYFWLSVPAGQEPRIYNTTIYVKEEKE